jgi:hypothetical protein
MKLNLRDLFWLILLVAISVAWWIERHSMMSIIAGNREEMAKLNEWNAQLESALAYKLTETNEGGRVVPAND